MNREVEGFGGKVVSQFAVLGVYDFVTILEAPDNETVARISSESGFPRNDRTDEHARVFRGGTHERTEEIKIAEV